MGLVFISQYVATAKKGNVEALAMIRVVGFFGVVLMLLAGTLVVARRDEPEQWIAFISDRDGNAEIYRMRPDGRDVQQSTHTEGDTTHCWVQWSHDSESLLFGRGSDEYCDYYNSPPENFEMRLDDGTSAEISEGWVLSVSSRDEWLAIIGWPKPILPSIFLVSKNGTEKIYVADGEEPSFSPDGRKLLFVGLDDGLYVYDIDKRELKKLDTPGLSRCYMSFAWDATSEWILFDAEEVSCGLVRLEKVNVENGTIEIIDNTPRVFTTQYYSNLSSSPDGKWYSYIFGNQLMVVESETGAFRDLAQIESLDRSAQRFDWSPDSEWIVFTNKDEHGNLKIFRIRPDGNDLEQLTFGEGDDSQPTWSPN